ncbi:DUF1045 domain-containing protein [soil metagenome]
MMGARYAIYYAPPAHAPLHRLAASWLGREAFTGLPAVQPDVPGIAEKTEEPRRYGFHATLKAPFRLGPDVKPEQLMHSVEAIAKQFAPISFPAIEFKVLDRFLALVPTAGEREIQILANYCVKKLDKFRAPLTPEEMAHRRKNGLSARLDTLLLNWGYPHVLDQFQFHLTLSNVLEPAELETLSEAAERHFAPVLNKPLVIDALCVFREPSPGAPFILKQRYPLCGPAEVAVPEPWKLGMR